MRTGVREADESDLPRILAITNEAITATASVWNTRPATLEARQAWMRDRQARAFPVLVATLDGTVQGFASYGDFRAWEGYLYTVEHSLYVDPLAQGHGLGRALLETLVAHATAQGKHVMVGGIEAENARSLELHRRAGFQEVGRLNEVGRKFGRWLDLIFVQKML